MIQTETQAKLRIVSLVQQVKTALGIRTFRRYSGASDPVAVHLGIVIRVEPLVLDEGLYFENPPTIVLNSQIADPDRLSFTFFHEVLHHLIRQDDELYSFIDQHTPSAYDINDVVDKYCNLGAAEFLIPADDVGNAIKEHGFSIALVESLEAEYPASKPAITIQLAECASHRCFLVICELGLPPRKRDQHPQLLNTFSSTQHPYLYVALSWASPAMTKYRIAKYTAIPSDHLITDCYAARRLLKGRANIPFASGKPWSCECEAFYYKGKVYATFNVAPPPPPYGEQLLLF
jgi:hypothetical protein